MTFQPAWFAHHLQQPPRKHPTLIPAWESRPSPVQLPKQESESAVSWAATENSAQTALSGIPPIPCSLCSFCSSRLGSCRFRSLPGESDRDQSHPFPANSAGWNSTPTPASLPLPGHLPRQGSKSAVSCAAAVSSNKPHWVEFY